MKESNINLYESTFPFNLAKNIKSIEGLENLGNLLDIIKVNFLIRITFLFYHKKKDL